MPEATATFTRVAAQYAPLPSVPFAIFVGARILLDRHPPTAEQHVLAAFIGDGYLERHIRRLRGIYGEQRHHVVEVFNRVLPAELGHVQPCDQGMHMVVWLRDDIDDRAVASAAVARGVAVRAVSPMYAPGTERPGLLLGFGGYRADDIEAAARRLATVIKTAAGGRGRRCRGALPAIAR